MSDMSQINHHILLSIEAHVLILPISAASAP